MSDLAKGEAPHTDLPPPRSENGRKEAAAPLTQREAVAATDDPAVAGIDKQKPSRISDDSGAPDAKLMAQRAIAKPDMDALKATVTHRPKVRSPTLTNSSVPLV